jgi:hypothetical protein
MNTELAPVTPQNPMALLVGQDMSQIDTVKLKEMMEMQERWEDRNAERQYNTAIAGFQAEMPPVFKWRKESQGKYNYASYDDIMAMARPILRKHGLALSFSQTETDSTITVVCTISHVGGHSRDATYTSPKDGPIKNQQGRNVTSEAQAQASANTYARRNCLCNALDIVVTDDDDNGQASADPVITEDQANEIYQLMDPLPPERRKGVLEWIKAESVDQIMAKDFEKVVKNLKRATS